MNQKKGKKSRGKRSIFLAFSFVCKSFLHKLSVAYIIIASRGYYPFFPCCLVVRFLPLIPYQLYFPTLFHPLQLSTYSVQRHLCTSKSSFKALFIMKSQRKRGGKTTKNRGGKWEGFFLLFKFRMNDKCLFMEWKSSQVHSKVKTTTLKTSKGSPDHVGVFWKEK